MSIEEFGLRLAAVGTLTIPPAGTTTVEERARGASDGDFGA